MTELTSTITCPACGHRKTETMRADACQYFYECESCGFSSSPWREIAAYSALTAITPVRRDRKNCRPVPQASIVAADICDINTDRMACKI